jgi:large subunit ribosomal protein L15
MGTTLHTLKGPKGATRNRKRIGRGPGSGTGEQSGKGVKGQKARTGHHGIPKPGFEGGQTAMARRLPKRGFHNPFRRKIFAVNLGDVAARFSAGHTGLISLEHLKDSGLVPRSAKYVKLLGTVREGQKLSAGFTVAAHFASASARKHLEGANGAFQEIAVHVPKKPTERRKSSAKQEAK